MNVPIGYTIHIRAFNAEGEEREYVGQTAVYHGMQSQAVCEVKYEELYTLRLALDAQARADGYSHRMVFLESPIRVEDVSPLPNLPEATAVLETCEQAWMMLRQNGRVIARSNKGIAGLINAAQRRGFLCETHTARFDNTVNRIMTAYACGNQLPFNLTYEVQYNGHRALLSRAAYQKKHRDFRGKFEDGTPNMLLLDPQTGATVLVPVMFTTAGAK